MYSVIWNKNCIMVERAPQIKVEEQYPLLKVNGGGGDGATNPQVAATLVSTGWGVTCTPKQSWLVRWPEYISACWMTLILLGISFLVFYALGMEAYRRQPVLLIKCNGSKPASNIFYHQIIPRGSSPPIMLYSEYLSNMAFKYPMLNFHVYFLIDDSVQNSYRAPRNARFINTLIPISLSTSFPFYKLDDTTKREISEFQRKCHNLNVTVMPLSKYMAMTPLKYKWRSIPIPYLSFYTRVFSVWQYGGVGLDLCTFNNYYNNRQDVDRRISIILKQHNDGIKPEEYTNALYKIDCEEESEKFFSLVYGLISSIFNETRTFFSKSFQFSRIDPEKDTNYKTEPLIRTHRNKRDVSSEPPKNNDTDFNSVSFVILNSTNVTDIKKGEYSTSLEKVDNINKSTIASQGNDSFILDNINLEGWNKSDTNRSDHPQLVLFYDFSVFSDGMGPSFIMPDTFVGSDNSQPGKETKLVQNVNTGSYLLSLDPEGLFIAASSRLHPFLGHLISAGCQRMHPKFAIQDTLLTQCSGLFKEDIYCNNIYLL
ncbi:unnamed protein product [Arctia plantaginis]|uniref:Uncharacterized protein n=1 Tax=Arctia plantaginis TaxID=874455 RepID=A0A8S0ZAF4_ARCPL|nr:unnamed protein product [Arctia plantaginis]